MAARKKQPAAKKSSAKKQAAKKQAAKKQAAKKQAATKRAATKQVGRKSAPKEPAVKKPATRKQAATRPAVTRGAAPSRSASQASSGSPRDDTQPPEAEALQFQEELRSNMMRSIVTEPLLSNVRNNPEGTFDVIISLNEFYKDGMAGALEAVRERAKAWNIKGYSSVASYVFGRLSARRITQLALESQELNAQNRRNEAVVYRIWEDSDIGITLTRSVTTIKADAAQRSFHALGEGIVWAVLDSGVEGTHEHFAEKVSVHGRVNTLLLRAPLEHRDYTPDGQATEDSSPDGEGAGSSPPGGHGSALVDRLGHGSHVAGIIGGYWSTDTDDGLNVVGTEVRDEGGGNGDESGRGTIVAREALKSIGGVAPLCKILSLKVIADVTRTDDAKQTRGQGKVSWVLRALDDIQTWNQNGKRILVHGVNMSLGYEFDPRWFACGQSPICAEVNRLVRSGVCVVVSAGNSGYSSYITGKGKEENSYHSLSITDPGNAELAITVGSTHRDMPHTYGVSYFSSRGPTGDGRRKPDLLAPGERIRSCAAGREQDRYGVDRSAIDPALEMMAGGGAPGSTAHAPPEGGTATAPDRAPRNGKVLYCEQTGTSMAAPHVSGAAAAFLSVRTEFIGQPERVKALFLANAIDLGREPTFQGSGLLDVMKVLQAV